MFYVAQHPSSGHQPWFSPDGYEWQPADFPPAELTGPGAYKYFNNRLFARTLGGVWATDTEGNNWQRVRSLSDDLYTAQSRLEVNGDKLYVSQWLGTPGSSTSGQHWYSTMDGDTWVQETPVRLEENIQLIAGNWYDTHAISGDRYIRVRRSPGEPGFASYRQLPNETPTWYTTGRRFYSRGFVQPGDTQNTYRYEDPPGSGQLHTITGWGPNSAYPVLQENSYAVLSGTPSMVSPVEGFPDFRPVTPPFPGGVVLGEHFTLQFSNTLYQSLDGVVWETRELPGPFEPGAWGAILIENNRYTKISFDYRRWHDVPPIDSSGYLYWNGVMPRVPGAGQWAYRQRQSLAGNGYPYRQRQNGGNTGSYPYRQRQRGL